MPSLLELPSELLFSIIDFVGSSPYPFTNDHRRHRPEQLDSRAVFCFPITDPSWPSHTRNLLLVCRKLHSETRNYISRAPQVFKLDVAVIDYHWIWPFWRYIPAGNTSNMLETLEINLIYCYTDAEQATQERFTQTVEIEVLKFITRFLRSGFTASFRGHSNFRIKTLIINMNTTNLLQSNQELSEDNVPFRKVLGLSHLTFDPLYPVDAACCLRDFDRIAEYVKVSIHNRVSLFTIRERVEKLVFSADGHVRKEIEIAKDISRKEARMIEEYRRRESI
ncbi:hypothetical protein GQ44DRAFT_572573, partial [Phaeosphaeriaceae sp. PMI808]